VSRIILFKCKQIHEAFQNLCLYRDHIKATEDEGGKLACFSICNILCGRTKSRVPS